MKNQIDPFALTVAALTAGQASLLRRVLKRRTAATCASYPAALGLQTRRWAFLRKEPNLVCRFARLESRCARSFFSRSPSSPPDGLA